ncbi:hypothetical protein BC343_23905 [Mucilaginibacter pedocola]|uniref:LuxR family transcriptional regulator n=2 Tax=Mucilaginibacter pedocola TaxID=1792845 RepID=A0A1S9PIG4_9SPHI|nr:hypothetical protein BC343_23905 [Mucilaginibacter pedocola]
MSVQEFEQSVNQMLADAENENNAFITRTGAEWLEHESSRPTPKKLFGEIWHQNELCILFSDTNVGKSILAVQIGDSIARGEAIAPFTFEGEAQKVIYFDFELSGKQFETRYVDGAKQRYNFGGNFLRAELNHEHMVPEGFDGFEDYICYCIEHEVIRRGAQIVIIDNITYLRSETEKAKDALPLMKQLKALKSKHNLSILALAHTPKRDRSQPISRNDLQGSKMLINFCDSAFSIGESTKDPFIRYLKQIKQRNTEELYGAHNVIQYQIVKPGNFLHYDFMSFGYEGEHLRQRTDESQKQTEDEIVDLRKQGLTVRQIGEQLGISFSKAARVLRDKA